MLKIPPEKLRKWRKQLYSIIFRTDTPAGKAFDIGLLVVILFSVLMASLESISTFSRQFAIAIKVAEWFITVCFTIEYALRIYSSRNRRKYIIVLRHYRLFIYITLVLRAVYQRYAVFRRNTVITVASHFQDITTYPFYGRKRVFGDGSTKKFR